MIITLNGEKKEFDNKNNRMSVAQLVETLNLKGFFAVELNLQIINKEDYNTISIKDGDTVEIVSFAGGG